MFQDPTFWTAVGFVILIAAIWKPASRAFASGLDARGVRIKAMLDEATKLREDAQNLLAEYQRRQRDAVKETEEIVEHAKAEAARMTERAAADLEVSLKRREQMAVEKIAQAESEALRQVRELSVDLAISAARTLIAERLNDAQRTELVDGAISELSSKLH